MYWWWGRSSGYSVGATRWSGAGPVFSPVPTRASLTSSSRPSNRLKSCHEPLERPLAGTGDFCAAFGRLGPEPDRQPDPGILDRFGLQRREPRLRRTGVAGLRSGLRRSRRPLERAVVSFRLTGVRARWFELCACSARFARAFSHGAGDVAHEDAALFACLVARLRIRAAGDVRLSGLVGADRTPRPWDGAGLRRPLQSPQADSCLRRAHGVVRRVPRSRLAARDMGRDARRGAGLGDGAALGRRANPLRHGAGSLLADRLV